MKRLTRLVGLLVALWSLTAAASWDTLVDFSQMVCGTDFYISTGKYASEYTAEQCTTSERGVTIRSDIAKQEKADAKYVGFIIQESSRGDIDWHNRVFELALDGVPTGRDSQTISLQMVDEGKEFFLFKPKSRYYDENGNLRFVFRDINAAGAVNHWGGDGDGEITGALKLAVITVQFTAGDTRPGEITFSKITAIDDVERTTEVVEPISLDSDTYPGAAPFQGAYRLVFTFATPQTGKARLRLYPQGDRNVTYYSNPTNFNITLSGETNAVFDVDLDPTLAYHYKDVQVASTTVVPTSGIAYERQTAAEAMRLEVVTGNDLHLCRGESERPKLVVSNPSTSAQHWTANFRLTDTFGRAFVIPFDATVPSGGSVDVALPWPLPAKGVWYAKTQVHGDDGSRALKETQFAWIPLHEVTPRMSKPKFRFGIHNHAYRYMPAGTNQLIRALVAAGAKFTRTDIGVRFGDICPSGEIYESGSANWNWGPADALMDMYINAGLSTLICNYTAPSWAWDEDATWNQTEKGRTSPKTGWRKTREGLYKNFCEKFAARYTGKIDYFEIGNELDLVPSEVISPTEALAIQKEAYEGLHAGDEDACVGPNGWAGAGDGADMWGIDNGIAEVFVQHPEYFDSWTIHKHGLYENYEELVDNQLKPLLAGPLAKNGTPMPWISGETAITSFENGEQEQGAHVWCKTLFAWNRGARDYIWYNLKATGWFDGNEPGYGLMTPDYHPRAGYAAFAAITDIFEGLDADGTVYESGSRKLFRYKGENLKGTINGIVIAGWDRGSKYETWKLRVKTDATSAEASDHMGNRTTVVVSDGAVEFDGEYLPRAVILQGATYARLEGANSWFSGRVRYVNASAAAGGNGSEESPFNTIDAAIAAASAGDKIMIAKGRYASTNTVAALGRTNIYLDKQLWLCGEGRTNTYIIGQHDANGTGGVGADAVRCVTISGATAAGSIFEKMTFLKGATAAGNPFGGAYADANATDVIFVDCTFRQCASDTSAGAAGGANEKFIRCLFDGNWCSAYDGGAALSKGFAGAYNCVFMRNIATGENSSGGQHGSVVGQGTTCNLVNCAYIGNELLNYPSDSTYGRHFNCVHLGSYLRSNHGGSVAHARSSMTVYYTTTDMGAGTLPGDWNTYRNHNTVTATVDKVSYYSITNTAFCIFSPLTFKFNPTPDSPLVASGNPAFVNSGASCKIDWVPEEYRNTDFEGNPRFTNGTICRGPVETIKDSPAAPVRVDMNMTLAGYEGSDIYVDRLLWYRSENYPSAEYLMATGSAVLAVYRANGGIDVSPDLKGGHWQLSKPNSSIVINRNSYDQMRSGNGCGAIDVGATMAADVKWADPKLDDYSAADGSEEHPFETLQQAVNACAANGVVFARRGTYDKGETYVENFGSNRVYIAKQLRIVGVDGAENTIIRGAFNEDVDNNRTGAKSVRGVYARVNKYTAVCGFTITGCSTIRATADNVSGNWAGAAYLGYTANLSQFADCIISNNYSLTSPVLYNAWAQRSVFIDNHQEEMVNSSPTTSGSHRGSVGCSATLSSCLVRAFTHTGRTSTLGSGSKVYGCTIHGHTSNRTMDDASPTRFNTIFYDSGCGAKSAANAEAYGWYTDICWEEQLAGFRAIANNTDPLFVDLANGDYRVLALSPAVTVGGNCTNYQEYTVGTLDGRSPIFGGNKTLVGCYGESVGYCVTGSELTPSGTNIITSAAPITFTLSNPRKRPFAEFRVRERGKDEYAVAGSSLYGGSFTWTPTDIEHDIVEVQPAYGTNWYVNATSGNDTTGDGFTPDTAMKTLAGIFGTPSKCEILSGDCVHAAEGLYDEGEMFNCAKNSKVYLSAVSRADMYSRVKVPDGVALVASGERERTIILGRHHSSSQRSGPVYGIDGDFPELPNNALRGVMLGHNSLLDGFIVSNGCATGSSGYERDDNSGGGIIGFMSDDANGPSYVRNCVVTGSGERNGAICGCVVESSYLYDNRCTSGGSQCICSKLINCVVKNSAVSAICKHHGIYNTTFVSSAYCSSDEELYSPIGAPICNSVLMLQFTMSTRTNTLKHLKNCVFWPATVKAYDVSAVNVIVDPATCENVLTQNVAWCKMDAANYYALKADSPLIDAGNKALVSDMPAVMAGDFFGSQRVYNGEIDIGASEYDWRAAYRDVLGYRRLSVVAASENVVKEQNTIRLGAGEKIVLGVENAMGFIANFEIPEGGTLTIFGANGETIAALGHGQTSHEIIGHSEVTLAYSGSGAAELKAFRSNVGLTIFVF